MVLKGTCSHLESSNNKKEHTSYTVHIQLVTLMAQPAGGEHIYSPAGDLDYDEDLTEDFLGPDHLEAYEGDEDYEEVYYDEEWVQGSEQGGSFEEANGEAQGTADLSSPAGVLTPQRGAAPGPPPDHYCWYY